MQLQKITLENIGCFTHLNLALDRRLLLVYGLGKTTVLKALETSLKPFNGIKPVPYFYLNGIAKCIIRDKNIIYENGVISLFYSIKNDLSSHSINIKSNSLVFEFPNDLEGDKIFLLFFKDNLVSINNRYNDIIHYFHNENKEFFLAKINLIFKIVSLIISNNNNENAIKFSRLINQHVIVNYKNSEIVIHLLNKSLLKVFYIVSSIIAECKGETIEELLQSNGIIVIDDIDANLSFTIQSVILPILLSYFPNIQIIVSTNSIGMLGSLKDPESYYLCDLDKHTAAQDMTENNPYGEDLNTLANKFLGLPIRNEEIERELEVLETLIAEGNFQLAEKAIERLDLVLGSSNSRLCKLKARLKSEKIISEVKAKKSI